jgi:autotransporter-associated beta strand protein
VLSGLTGQSFVGNSEVNAGELFLDGTSVLSGSALNTLTLNAGGTLRIGASGGIGAVTLVNKGGILITNGVQDGNQVFAATAELTDASAKFNGVQAIGAGVTVTAESDFFGTTPDSPTEARIVMNNATTLRSTGAIEIHENKGIRLAGSSATFDTSSGTISIKSEISGSGKVIKDGNEDFSLVNTNNSYTGGTEIRGGTFGINGDGSLGEAGTGVVIDGATLNTGQGTSGQTITIGSNRSIQIAKGKTNNLDASNGSMLVYDGVISEFGATGSANIQINTAGSRAGKVVLGGVNTHTGATNINAGTLEVRGSGSINSSSAINVAAGATFIYNSSTSLAVGPTLGGSEGNKARFSGAATINAEMSLNHINDVLAPGNSPGIHTYTVNQSWESFTYEWELRDWVNSVLGADVDFIQINGSLELAGRAYQLEIVSLNALNAAGPVGEGGQGNQFAESSRSWTILTTTGGIQGFDAEDWKVDVTRFQDNFLGNWSLSQSGDSLVLNYIAVPEPRAALLGGIGVFLLLRRRR